MDEIQKVLIKAGRKDLAQKYYEKVARTYASIKQDLNLKVCPKIKEKLQSSIFKVTKVEINPQSRTNEEHIVAYIHFLTDKDLEAQSVSDAVKKLSISEYPEGFNPNDSQVDYDPVNGTGYVREEHY